MSTLDLKSIRFRDYCFRKPVEMDAGGFPTKIKIILAFGAIYLTFTAYIWLLKIKSPTQVSTHAFVNPLVAVFVGWFAGGELLSPRILTAALLMVTGVAAIVTRTPASFSSARNSGSTKLTRKQAFLKGKRAQHKEAIVKKSCLFSG